MMVDTLHLMLMVLMLSTQLLLSILRLEFPGLYLKYNMQGLFGSLIVL